VVHINLLLNDMTAVHKDSGMNTNNRRKTMCLIDISIQIHLTYKKVHEKMKNYKPLAEEIWNI
jgi:hypothetical protein